ncbi:hypothetical protein CK203_036580 [Vitis vinifera]|uniref:Uncharacterized protein n=1 Tax=Vitis vinifera TaxID=29760 RepID=A0A438HZM3_VITVI|nr:hypothetical protein CK203_036580 [Vitis vinifera]
MSTKCYSKIFVIGYNNHMNPVMPFYPYPGCYFIYQIRPLVCSSYIDLLLCSIICFWSTFVGHCTNAAAIAAESGICFQTLEAVKRICPKRALLVGMTHEFDHHKDNETLMEWSRRLQFSDTLPLNDQSPNLCVKIGIQWTKGGCGTNVLEGIPVQLAHDGLRVPIDL